MCEFPSPEVELLKHYLIESAFILDEEFGEGYAKKNPNLIIKMIDELSKYRLQQITSRE